MMPVFTVFYVVAYACFFFCLFFCACLQADMWGWKLLKCTIEILFVVSLIAFHV